MRYAILSDIHANLAAFQEVLKDIARQKIDQIWCLGDTVGYGPFPNECIELLRAQDNICVAGNHDWGSTGKYDISRFNRDAAFACQWTGTVLTTSNYNYLRELPEKIKNDSFTIVHGSPRHPIWEYIMNHQDAIENLSHFDTPFCLAGHTHYPAIFRTFENQVPLFRHISDGEEISLSEGRYIINPGSVGQPRDGDPRGSYTIYDTNTNKITLYRIPYDIAQTQQRMRENGLPSFLIEHLERGI